MNQTLATVIGFVAIAAVLAVPLTIMWLVGRANKRVLAAVDAWALEQGLQRSEASASALIHPSVPSISFARGRDLVSFSCQAGGAHRSTFTIYVRPDQARLPPMGLQRNMFGGGGEALGDPGLDPHYRLLHGGAAAIEWLCSPQVHQLLIRDHEEVVRVYVHEGVLLLTYELGQSLDPDAWDRAWTLVDRMLATSRPASAQVRQA